MPDPTAIAADKPQSVRPLITWSYVGLTVLLFVIAIFNPIHNWDMIAYIASAEKMNTDDKVAIHEHTYGSLKRTVGAEDFAVLTTGPYRSAVAADPEVLSQQLPYYQPRVFYTSLINIVVRAGVDPVNATHWITASSTALGVLILFFAFRHEIHERYLLLIPLIFVFSGGLEVARFATADATGFLCLSVMTYFWLKKRPVIYLLLPLAILARTDYALLAGSIVIHNLLFVRKHMILSVVCLAIAALTFQWINAYFGSYGWQNLIVFSFIDRFTHGAEVEVSLTFAQYVQAFVSGFRGTLASPPFMLCAIGTVLMLYKKIKKSSLRAVLTTLKSDNLFVLHLFAAVYTVFHYILFPAMWSRFFAGVYVWAGLALIVYFVENSDSLRARFLGESAKAV